MNFAVLLLFVVGFQQRLILFIENSYPILKLLAEFHHLYTSSKVTFPVSVIDSIEIYRFSNDIEDGFIQHKNINFIEIYEWILVNKIKNSESFKLNNAKTCAASNFKSIVEKLNDVEDESFILIILSNINIKLMELNEAKYIIQKKRLTIHILLDNLSYYTCHKLSDYNSESHSLNDLKIHDFNTMLNHLNDLVRSANGILLLTNSLGLNDRERSFTMHSNINYQLNPNEINQLSEIILNIFTIFSNKYALLLAVDQMNEQLAIEEHVWFYDKSVESIWGLINCEAEITLINPAQREITNFRALEFRNFNFQLIDGSSNMYGQWRLKIKKKKSINSSQLLKHCSIRVYGSTKINFTYNFTTFDYINKQHYEKNIPFYNSNNTLSIKINGDKNATKNLNLQVLSNEGKLLMESIGKQTHIRNLFSVELGILNSSFSNFRLRIVGQLMDYTFFNLISNNLHTTIIQNFPITLFTWSINSWNNHVQLNCEVYSVFESFHVVEFYKNSRLLKRVKSSSNTAQSMVYSTEIPLNSDLFGKNFICKATSSNGLFSLKQLTIKSIDVVKNISLIDGEILKLYCFNPMNYNGRTNWMQKDAMTNEWRLIDGKNNKSASIYDHFLILTASTQLNGTLVSCTTINLQRIHFSNYLLLIENPSIKAKKTTIYYDVGDEIEIACLTSGISLIPVTWWHEKNSIAGEKYGDSFYGNLIIHDAEESDEGTYKCYAEYNHLKLSSDKLSLLFDEITLIHNYYDWNNSLNDSKDYKNYGMLLSDNLTAYEDVNIETLQTSDNFPTIQKISPSLTTSYGSNIYVDCHVNGNPKPVVAWSRTKLRLVVDYSPENDHWESRIFPNGTLLVKNVKFSSIYFCSATNIYGSISATVNVVVTEAPIVIMDNIESVIENSDMLLKCMVLGNHPINLTWSFKMASTSMKNVLQRTVLNNSRESKLVIQNFSIQNVGFYTCHALNEFGEDSKSFFTSLLSYVWSNCSTNCGYGFKTGSVCSDDDKNDCKSKIVPCFELLCPVSSTHIDPFIHLKYMQNLSIPCSANITSNFKANIMEFESNNLKILKDLKDLKVYWKLPEHLKLMNDLKLIKKMSVLSEILQIDNADLQNQGNYSCFIENNGFITERFIEITVDRPTCNLNGDLCTNNTVCIQNNSSWLCVEKCKVGFTRSGLICNDVDECLDGNHNCLSPSECLNINGSFECTCPIGLQLLFDESLNSYTCTDIDECIETNLLCHYPSICVNSVGSFECHCPAGFIKNNSSDCEDIDECKEDVDQCDQFQQCTNIEGSFICNCFNGFEMNSLGICEDIDECKSVSCAINSNCMNTLGSYMCTCKNGYIYSNEQTECIDIDECLIEAKVCPIDAKCLNNNGSFICQCLPGFIHNISNNSCNDIDECSNFDERVCSVSTSCRNTIGSYFCDVLSLSTPSSKTCAIGKQSICQYSCFNNGSYDQCICPGGYFLAPDESTCCDIDECLQPNKCPTNMKCKNTYGSYRCINNGCPMDFKTDSKGNCMKVGSKHQNYRIQLIITEWIVERYSNKMFSLDITKYLNVYIPNKASMSIYLLPNPDSLYFIIKNNARLISKRPLNPKDYHLSMVINLNLQLKMNFNLSINIGPYDF